MDKILSGNLEKEGLNSKGWVIGHFKDKGTIFNNEAFEVKWFEHKKGEKKPQGAKFNNTAKTISILIRGKFKLVFPNEDKELILEKEGDYIYWDSNVVHDWEALEDSLVLTLRWPSVPNDQK